MKEEQVLKAAEKNLDFFNQHFKEFEIKYPNKFVAVSGAKIVAIEKNPDSIFKKLDEKKINRSNVLVEFMPLAGSILVL